jgi:dihydrofolate reductase
MDFRVGMIVAVSPEGVIGLHGTIPWRYPGDVRRFKRVTMDSTVIMGRLTWESIGKPLPGRRNVVVTSQLVPGVECHPDIPSALASSTGRVWFIGGVRIYAEAMAYADLIDVTRVPDYIGHPDAVRFPPIDPGLWIEGPIIPHEDEPSLTRQEYLRRRP